jgi:hypothetical protein
MGYIVQGRDVHAGPSIDIELWLPDGDEPIGESHAAELVAALRRIVALVVDRAVRDPQTHLDPGSEVIRSGAPASYIARFSFDKAQVRPVSVGTVC